MIAEFQNSINSYSKQLENQKKMKQLFLGNEQVTGKDGDPWEKGNDKGKPRDTPVWPLEADSRSLHRTKQPRSLNELK